MTAAERKRLADRERQRALRAKRRAAGVCPRCGGPLPAGAGRCAACLAAAARQMASWRRRNGERGCCPRCGGPLEDRRWKRCADCRAKSLAVELARLARLRDR